MFGDTEPSDSFVPNGARLRPRLSLTSLRTFWSRGTRYLERRYLDPQLRQLKTLRKAYAKGKGPDVLIFGDSNMVWAIPGESDPRRVFDMIRDEMPDGVTTLALVGAMYNPRIIRVFLEALKDCRGRPRVVVVPMSGLIATDFWLAHPRFGYEREARQLRDVISGTGPKRRRLDRPSYDEWEAWDRLPCPSLLGLRRTAAEWRMIVDHKPTSRWQQVVRLRHVMDVLYAGEVKPDDPGVQMTADLAAYINELGLGGIAYFDPVNADIVFKMLGPGAEPRITGNAEVLTAAFTKPLDRAAVLDALYETPGNEFGDPVHLKSAGRMRLAKNIVAAVTDVLDQASPASSPSAAER